MKKPMITKTLLFFSLFVGIAMLPNYASARVGVSIQLPGLSIGVNDRYTQRRYYDSRYRTYRYVPRTTYRTYNYPSSRSYNYPSSRSYNYPSSRSYSYPSSRKIYTPSYQSSVCPTPGYSEYYYEGHGCYQHGDHYHCD